MEGPFRGDVEKRLSEVQEELDNLEDKTGHLELRKAELEKILREKDQADVLSMIYDKNDALCIVNGWKARLRVLRDNRPKSNNYIEFSFKDKGRPVYENITIDKLTQEELAQGSKMELEACISLGISHNTKVKGVKAQY